MHRRSAEELAEVADKIVRTLRSGGYSEEEASIILSVAKRAFEMHNTHTVDTARMTAIKEDV